MELIKAHVKDFTSSTIVNALKKLKASPIAVMGAPALGDVVGYQGLEILATVGAPIQKW